uniref:t-SNARE coiled-coil homology domain-containing protein n=1 Tax=Chlamydomonas euryale TaxID=1486919 RepID=A0A7R9VXU5_9CHLO|mmetsp:Transcript_7125/g.21735  ORF Transcript_7125/g.21735 Transcript_7125/m.21735 type:complete len:308 (+) Transcript_7125:368-1291(+)
MAPTAAIGSTRNLTSQFKRFRDEARRLRPEGVDMDTAALLNSALGGSSTDVEMTGVSILSPAWVQSSEKIRLDLRVLKDQLMRLKEAHAKVLLVSFDSSNDAQAHADALTRELQLGFKNVTRDIAELDAPRNTDSADDAEVRREVKQQLARALMSLTMDFRKAETRFLGKVEAQKGLAAGSAMGLLDDAGVDDWDRDGGFSTQQVGAMDSALTSAIERDREIVRIVETITELAQIMRDLSTLVVEQGTILDRIDANIQNTAVQIDEGVKHIVQAEKKQKSTRMFMCIVALIIVIIVMVVIVAAKIVL